MKFRKNLLLTSSSLREITRKNCETAGAKKQKESEWKQAEIIPFLTLNLINHREGKSVLFSYIAPGIHCVFHARWNRDTARVCHCTKSRGKPYLTKRQWLSKRTFASVENWHDASLAPTSGVFMKSEVIPRIPRDVNSSGTQPLFPHYRGVHNKKCWNFISLFFLPVKGRCRFFPAKCQLASHPRAMNERQKRWKSRLVHRLTRHRMSIVQHGILRLFFAIFCESTIPFTSTVGGWSDTW